MKINVLVSLCFLSLFIISNLNAKTYLLSTIDSQAEEDNTTQFILTTEGPNDDAKTFTQKKYLKENPQEVLIHQVFNLENYQANKNLVLERRGDMVVVQMRSSNFAPHNGGNITVDFLYNGITGKRSSSNLELVRGGSGWQLVDKNGKVIRRMYLISHKIAFKTVGIDHIEFYER